MNTTISAPALRPYLVMHHGLDRVRDAAQPGACRALLAQLRCIQLDPLDRIGTNAELVAMARLDGLRRGELYERLFPGGAFEHFAKERCLLPPSAFAWYRTRAAQTPWWRLGERQKRLDPGLIEAVYEEIAARGPLGAAALTDQGAVEPLDWSGWKGTARAATMALEVLWTQCRVVVCERTARGKRYDLPERALPPEALREVDPHGFERWALRERVAAAGLLSRAGGPWWSMLHAARTSPLVDAMLAAGELEEVVIEGSRRSYLALPGWRERLPPPDALDGDARMRIIAPLDPLIWDRKLVAHVFGFEYVWEVYKPQDQRRWGYYVCPLLQRGRLVGRFEGRLGDDGLEVLGLWPESSADFDRRAFDEALERHAAACETQVVQPRTRSRKSPSAPR